MKVLLHTRLAVPATLTLLICSGGPAAFAQSNDPAGAEVLFQEARTLMKRGDFDAACPKFSESQRLDPATGTLLAVAACHERQGLLATAWAEFLEAAGRARQEGREDRVLVATRRAEALQPKLSTLTIRVPEALGAMKGLKVERDGLVLERSQWNRAMPVDGGSYRVIVNAPGFANSEVVVEVPRELGSVHAQVPQLKALEVEAALPLPELAPDSPDAPRSTAVSEPDLLMVDAPSPGGGRYTLGTVLMISGGASLLGAAYAWGGALRRKSISNRYCTADSCFDQDGERLLREATAWGNTATGLGIVGAVAGGIGLTLYLTSTPSGNESAELASKRFTHQITLQPSGVMLSGAF